jgi:phosphoglycolate/pyridoxal phosphate phosphatase family enzyme
MYLEQNPLPPGKKVYVIGQSGIGEELDLLNIPNFGGPLDNDKKVDVSGKTDFIVDPDVGAVVVGIDVDINYYKIQYAQLCLNQNKNCLFIATNQDATAHLTSAQKWAGNGAIVGAIKGCTGRDPIVVGKPSPLIVDYLINKFGFVPSRICMVGDRLDTDILFGLNNGLRTVLTLSGVTTEEKLFCPQNHIVPHYYVNSVADFVL